MEQLIIFLLFIVGSIISSILQHKKKKAEEQQQQELEELTRRGRGEEPRPVQAPSPFPKTAADWQEQLRRMLEGEPAPEPKPPVLKPVLLPPVQSQPPPRSPQAPKSTRSDWQPMQKGTIVPAKMVETVRRPLKTSAAYQERAAALQESVQKRVQAIAEQTGAHKLATPNHRRTGAHSAFVRRLRKNPRAIREAFIASVIFNPPKSVEPGTEDALRA